jgi:hypothetical protein
MDNETINKVIGNLLKLSNSIHSSIVPEDAKRHFRSACKEALLGMIAILDYSNEKHKNHTSESVHQEKSSSQTINISD